MYCSQLLVDVIIYTSSYIRHHPVNNLQCGHGHIAYHANQNNSIVTIYTLTHLIYFPIAKRYIANIPNGQSYIRCEDIYHMAGLKTSFYIYSLVYNTLYMIFLLLIIKFVIVSFFLRFNLHFYFESLKS
jgi:hypothetical protein